jgi:hypothetical protein
MLPSFTLVVICQDNMLICLLVFFSPSFHHKMSVDTIDKKEENSFGH